jgi:hypothetical protein
MTLHLRTSALAAMLGAMTLLSSQPARAASSSTAAQRQNYLRILAIGVPVPLPNPPPFLTQATIRRIDRNVARLGVRRIPPIPRAVRNASPLVIASQRAIILERYRQLALRQGGAAFGGVFPAGGTSYIPTQPINIVSYFPVFRV